MLSMFFYSEKSKQKTPPLRTVLLQLLQELKLNTSELYKAEFAQFDRLTVNPKPMSCSTLLPFKGKGLEKERLPKPIIGHYEA
ncbi:hypothetical protein D3C72_624390 [compost metagenome]